MHLSRWALKSYEMPTLDSSLSVKDVPSSMFGYESLWILQTVCLHLDGHHMVTWDHGQTQNSGLSLGESVWNHRRIDHFKLEIYSNSLLKLTIVHTFTLKFHLSLVNRRQNCSVYPTCGLEELLSRSKDDVTVSVRAEEQSHQGSSICHPDPHVLVQESF